MRPHFKERPLTATLAVPPVRAWFVVDGYFLQESEGWEMEKNVARRTVSALALITQRLMLVEFAD